MTTTTSMNTLVVSASIQQQQQLIDVLSTATTIGTHVNVQQESSSEPNFTTTNLMTQNSQIFTNEAHSLSSNHQERDRSSIERESSFDPLAELKESPKENNISTNNTTTSLNCCSVCQTFAEEISSSIRSSNNTPHGLFNVAKPKQPSISLSSTNDHSPHVSNNTINPHDENMGLMMSSYYNHVIMESADQEYLAQQQTFRSHHHHHYDAADDEIPIDAVDVTSCHGPVPLVNASSHHTLGDLPFEMLFHILTFLPHQDDLTHEYEKYWSSRERCMRKLHAESKKFSSSSGVQWRQRFVRNLIESSQSLSQQQQQQQQPQKDHSTTTTSSPINVMVDASIGGCSAAITNYPSDGHGSSHLYYSLFKNVHFWQLICEFYFNLPKTENSEPPVDRKTLISIYGKEPFEREDSPTTMSKIVKLGDWLQTMLNISNSSELNIPDALGTEWQVVSTGAVQTSGANASLFISTNNTCYHQELALWQYSYHYLHCIPARFDQDSRYMLPIFQMVTKPSSVEDPSELEMSAISELTRKSCMYNTCIQRSIETDNKKSPNDYRWRNATSSRTFSPNNLYYFEFYVEKIGGINLGVGLVPNIHFTAPEGSNPVPKDFNPTHFDNYIWPSGSCHHCFEINNQRYYSGDVVGMLVDYSYSEKNVLKIHFCHNWHKKDKRRALFNKLKKIREIETKLSENHHSSFSVESVDDELCAFILDDELKELQSKAQSNITTSAADDEEDINYPFKENQMRLIYFTDDMQTQFPECVIGEGRNELISFMKVNSKDQHNSSPSKRKDVKIDVQSQRPTPSKKELILPDFKLCVTTYDKDDSVSLIRPSQPYPPLYYHLQRKGRYDRQDFMKSLHEEQFSEFEKKELRKLLLDEINDYHSQCKTTTSTATSTSTSTSASNDRSNKCLIM
ncbi:hypothetical protein C9374_007404 [Naegleria lovaniensis]|uniref:F-box domain-containing protein n=1 Tax=Naegleria lovaniensis TaxID=51637 RepID=A0AA88GM21_NAELO|nr:uncharacterized protein C9374_007404 [Naegleria lovaniensis]KAG2379265.1 hypothetical protein C9374_007404 [Naegleria lovaniensis]